MNILFIVLASAVILLIAYLFYGKFLAVKVFNLNDKNITPAEEFGDGNDYVPAKKGMLLGQHFSAIAAAGPITGPILAAILFGWLPALLWVLIGSIFIGGIHDMGSLVASIRHKARSITEVIRENVSQRAWALFMLFIWITLVYIIVAFTDTTASSFVGAVALEDGSQVLGGGIASSSILYLILPVIMGFLLKHTKLKEGAAIAIFLPLVGVAIWVGQYIPVTLPFNDVLTQQKVWGLLILVYCLIASVVPMWALLQPRGALGGWFLYIALAVAAIGLIFGGFEVQYPAFTSASDGLLSNNFWFPMFPVLFITIACGACSGFHALVSSGTTCKQLRKESDAKPVAYGAMLLEAMVAVISIACVMKLPLGNEVLSKAPNFVYATGIGSFMNLINIPAAFGISFGLMAFTTFVYDTLDVCTRLGRYIFAELIGKETTLTKAAGSILTAFIPLIFVFMTVTDAAGKPIPAWRVFWNTFGASNQLLAALALIGVTVWLYTTKGKDSKIYLVSLIPAVIMFVMSNWSLLNDMYNGFILGKGTMAIPIISLILFILSVFVALETIVVLARKKRQSPVDFHAV
jgi:carbon starvation protein